MALRELLPTNVHENLFVISDAQATTGVRPSLDTGRTETFAITPTLDHRDSIWRESEPVDRLALHHARDRVEVGRQIPGRPTIDEPNRGQREPVDIGILQPGWDIWRADQAGQYGLGSTSCDPAHDARSEERRVDEIRLFVGHDPAQLADPRNGSPLSQEANVVSLGHHFGLDAFAPANETDDGGLNPIGRQSREQLRQRPLRSSGTQPVDDEENAQDRYLPPRKRCAAE
jgi:hypothetical protein